MTETTLEIAIRFAEYGYSIIPIDPNTKTPLVKWREFQNRIASEEEMTRWLARWPKAQIAMATGSLSGLVVVDCDSMEALEAAIAIGFDSPCRVKTKRGMHLYHRHPQDGQHYGNHQGGNPGSVWPAINGLDFRGDGGYVLIPPSKGYEWHLHDDLAEAPKWSRWQSGEKPAEVVEPGEFSFAGLDLSAIKITKFDMMTEWDRTATYIKDAGFLNGLIPTGQGNGRNERVFRFAAEQIKLGYFGPELRMQGRKFMAVFFADPLKDREFEDSMSSIEAMERRNHPERFDQDGNFTFQRADIIVEAEGRRKIRRLITSKDAERLIEQGQGGVYHISPFLRPGSITQVYGYTGSGKTMFLQGAVYALAAGAPRYGPFEIPKAAKVLYMDFEMSMGDMGFRLRDLKKIFGDAGDNMMIWAPWVDGEDYNFHNEKDINSMMEWVTWAAPEVIVIDTVRTAWAGLAENSAEEWAKVNKLAKKLRDSGYAIILIHHSNKPGEDGQSSYAGSTNQLTVIETQMKVSQVYRDKDTALMKAGICDASYMDKIGLSPMDELEQKLRLHSPHFFLSMVIELRYGKVRQPTPLHDDVQWVGWGTHMMTGEKHMVWSRSSKERAIELKNEGKLLHEIAAKLHKEIETIKVWLGIPLEERDESL